MENPRKSTLRSKRKPLSDCTNTRHNNPPSKTLIKPPKFTPILKNNNNKKNKIRNPNLSSNKSDLVVSGSSVTLDLSTGSNNSPNFGGVVGRKSTASATQTQMQDEQTRKDKGKSVESTPIVQSSSDTAPQAMQISSSAASDDGAPVSSSSSAENHELDEHRRKDKGKMVVETPIIEIITPIVQTSSDTAPQAMQMSSSAASDDGGPVSSSPSAENHELDEQRRKDKGKMVVETPIIEIITPLTSDTLQASSSSAASGNHHLSGRSAVDNHKQDAQANEGSEKLSQETSNIEAFGPATPPAVMTSSAASGNRCLPGPSAVDSHKQGAQANKGIEKGGQETLNIEASGPVTPRPVFTSSSVASGTDGQEKTSLIVYNQRRTSQRKKFGAGSISLPFSCPPSKKAKKKGIELEGSDSRAGSRTDPLPLHKKKRARNKKDDSMHAMPQDEVAKLKAYFADLDAFELPEEVASESD